MMKKLQNTSDNDNIISEDIGNFSSSSDIDDENKEIKEIVDSELSSSDNERYVPND